MFSGGKYEYRKGQDYVLAAMREFMKHHADVTLIAAWHNQWQESINTMANSWLIDPKDPWAGLPEDRCHLLPAIPNAKTPEIYAQAHIGLFPNRCEAGTNLVMSEFMACERPVIASYATGHKDVFRAGDCPSCSEWVIPTEKECQNCGEARNPYPYLLTNGSYDPAGWFNPNVSDIIAHLEHAYQHRDQLAGLGAQCRTFTERLTWGACAEKIVQAAFGDLGSVSQDLAAR